MTLADAYKVAERNNGHPMKPCDAKQHGLVCEALSVLYAELKRQRELPLAALPGEVE